MLERVRNRILAAFPFVEASRKDAEEMDRRSHSHGEKQRRQDLREQRDRKVQITHRTKEPEPRQTDANQRQ